MSSSRKRNRQGVWIFLLYAVTTLITGTKVAIAQKEDEIDDYFDCSNSSFLNHFVPEGLIYHGDPFLVANFSHSQAEFQDGGKHKITLSESISKDEEVLDISFRDSFIDPSILDISNGTKLIIQFDEVFDVVNFVSDIHVRGNSRLVIVSHALLNMRGIIRVDEGSHLTIVTPLKTEYVNGSIISSDILFHNEIFVARNSTMGIYSGKRVLFSSISGTGIRVGMPANKSPTIVPGEIDENGDGIPDLNEKDRSYMDIYATTKVIFESTKILSRSLSLIEIATGSKQIVIRGHVYTDVQRSKLEVFDQYIQENNLDEDKFFFGISVLQGDLHLLPLASDVFDASLKIKSNAIEAQASVAAVGISILKFRNAYYGKTLGDLGTKIFGTTWPCDDFNITADRIGFEWVSGLDGIAGGRVSSTESPELESDPISQEPEDFFLYPNPIKSNEWVSGMYTVRQEEAEVTLFVYDLKGRLIRSEEVGTLVGGQHPINLSTKGLVPNTTYTVNVLEDGKVTQTIRLLIEEE